MLTTLDEVIADMGGPLPGTTAHQLQQVRDAVAGLAEQARYALLALQEVAPSRCPATIDGLRAALAPIGGAE